MLPPDRELEFLKFLDRLSTHLKQMRDPRKALRHSLRDAREFVNATHGCLAVVQGGRPDAHVLFAIPKNGQWDLDVLARFIRHERPEIRDDLLIAPCGGVEDHGLRWRSCALDVRTTGTRGGSSHASPPSPLKLSS